MDPRTIGVRAFAIAWSVIVSIGCTQDSTAPTPTPTPTSTPSPSPQPAGVRFTGVALDADTDETIADAVVSVRVVITTGRGGVPPDPPSRATTDQNGRFVLYVVLYSDATGLELNVTKPGFDPGSWSTPLPAADMVLRVYRTLSIRPGDSIEFRLFLNDYLCGAEGYRCRRVLVESPTGGDVDLESEALDERGFADLVPHPEPYSFTGYTNKITTRPGQVWVAGGAPKPALGRTRLTAKLH